MTRPTAAIIDIQALRENFALAQRLAPNANSMPMVKANAYGHGIVRVAQALEDMAPAYGVACIEEALELREANIKQPLLLLEGPHSADEVEIADQQSLWLMLENHTQLKAVLNAKLQNPVNVWIKLDTGMHRLGFQPNEAQGVFQQLSDSPNVAASMVLATHFSCADNLDNNFTHQQLASFDAALKNLNPSNLKTSLANSAAILDWPEVKDDWQRPGYMLYGNTPFAQSQKNADPLKPVMHFQSAVISTRTIAAGESVGYTANWTANRPSIIATVAVGYGDGYPRHAENGTPVLIGGIKCPLVGRVSMDMISVDITDLPKPIGIGEPVTLWGLGLGVNEVARHCRTIGYELLTRMPARVPRIYT
ncbi:MAG: alanine racemase [Porticoccaceae bacterium]|nr:alanine racemase [Porticoccaceae bacterium]